MFVIRPVEETDLEALTSFAFETAPGMISLPRDKKQLKEKINRSKASIQTKVRVPRDEIYLFVLENQETGEVIGCSAIYAKTAVREPFYCFRIETQHPQKQVQEWGSAWLDPILLPKEIRVLHPHHFSNGPTELCSLFLKKEWRKEKLGTLLSLFRFLFITSFPERFDKQVFVSLRGVMNTNKKTSPFWEGIGKHFLNLDFLEIQALQNQGTAFILEFLPSYPIYVSLLDKEVQEVVGKTHSTTQPAEKLLMNEGFHHLPLIDLFDGGPFLGSKTKDIHTIKNSFVATVEEILPSNSSAFKNSQRYLICNEELKDFRSCFGMVRKLTLNKIILSEETAKLLNIQAKSSVRLTKHA